MRPLTTPRRREALLLTAVLALGATGCGPGAPEAPQAPYTSDDGTYHVPVLAQDMRFVPAQIAVPDGRSLVIELTNVDGMPHDLVLPDGTTSGLISRGEDAVVDVGPVTEAFEAWCSVQGHRAAGMVLDVAPA